MKLLLYRYKYHGNYFYAIGILRPNFIYLILVVKTYGTIVGIYIGNEPSVVLADFEVIKDVFKRNEASGRPSMIPFRDIRSGYWLLDEENSGNLPGIAFSQGKFCSQQKRFTSRALKQLGILRKSMESIILMEVEKCCTELARFEGKPFLHLD